LAPGAQGEIDFLDKLVPWPAMVLNILSIHFVVELEVVLIYEIPRVKIVLTDIVEHLLIIKIQMKV
jgi:hypothetical protein